jgi:hypothetical protein
MEPRICLGPAKETLDEALYTVHVVADRERDINERDRVP